MNSISTRAGLLVSILAALAGCGTTATPTGSDAGNSDAITGPVNCQTTPTYPPGPYGTGPGNTIADFALRVQTGANGAPATKMLSDYRAQCVAGTLKVLAIFGAAEWCAPCKQEQPELVTDWNNYQSMKSGVAFVDAVVQKNDQSPADDSTEKAWGTAFNIPFDLASDPNSALGPYLDPSTFPASMVIRLSDMTIEAQWTGLMPGMTESEVDMALQ